MTGPRLYTVGRPARFVDGLCKLDTERDADLFVAKRKEMGGSTVKQYMLPNRIQRQLLLTACDKAGLNMTNEGTYDVIAYLNMIKDGSTGVEHNPNWGDVYNDIIQFTAKSGVFLTPTLQVTGIREHAKEYFKYKFWNVADKKMKYFLLGDTSQSGATINGAESLRTVVETRSQDTVMPGFLASALINNKMKNAGANVTMGSHGNNQGIGAHNEIWALNMAGFTRMEALRASTIDGAKALGIQQDIGSLEVGKIADMVILNANPLEDIHNSRDIMLVIKNGIIYDGDTLRELN
jgi:hypothetical protein